MADFEYDITVGKDGHEYLKVKGRKGWPIRMMAGETPADAVARMDAKRMARDYEKAAKAAADIPDAIRDLDDEAPPRPKDPGPRVGAPKISAKGKPSTKDLEGALAELLVMPALPAKVILHCDYCTAHFLAAGPQAARELAMMSESNEALRALLTRLHAAMSTITWVSILGGYVAKPLIHHAAPQEIRLGAGAVIGVPPNAADMAQAAHEAAMSAAAEQQQTPAQAAAYAAAQAAGAQTYADMTQATGPAAA